MYFKIVTLNFQTYPVSIELDSYDYPVSNLPFPAVVVCLPEQTRRQIKGRSIIKTK